MVAYLPVLRELEQEQQQQQQQPLLHNNENNYAESSNDEIDEDGGVNDDCYYNSKKNHSSTLLTNHHYHNNINNSNNCNNNRNRFYLHRSRRFRCNTKFITISIAILIIFLLIYIPLYNISQSRLVSIPGWGYNTSRNVSDYILPDKHTALIEPRNICRKSFFLMVVVCSSVENFSIRQTIRETWGNVTEFNYPLFHKMHSHLNGQYLDIKELNLRMYADYLGLSNVTYLNDTSHYQNFRVNIVFLVGISDKNSLNYNETLAKLKLESEQYNDIIQENFLDTYNNLTIKSIMMLKWIINNQCLTKGKFLMKCDDDTFVNIPNLLHILLGGTIPVYNSTIEFFDPITIKVLSPSNRLITKNLLTGYLFCMVKPIADITSKWYAPIYMYNNDIYPNYISGSSYLMSFDIINNLYNVTLNTSLLHLEDVYLTGICAEKIHIKRRHHPLFSFNHKQNKCTYKGTITQHYIKGDLMHDIYNFVTNTTIQCSPPDKYFKMKRLRKRLKSCY